MPTYRIVDAARLLGVSDDTARRWAQSGRFASMTDDTGHLAVDGEMPGVVGHRGESAGFRPPPRGVVTDTQETRGVNNSIRRHAPRLTAHAVSNHQKFPQLRKPFSRPGRRGVAAGRAGR